MIEHRAPYSAQEGQETAPPAEGVSEHQADAADVLARHTLRENTLGGLSAPYVARWCVECGQRWGDGGCDAVVQARRVVEVEAAISSACAALAELPMSAEWWALHPGLAAAFGRLRGVFGTGDGMEGERDGRG